MSDVQAVEGERGGQEDGLREEAGRGGQGGQGLLKRVNVGCGNYPMDDHINVDLFEPADVVGNFIEMRFKGMEHVEMSHVLEHISWRDVRLALAVVFDWLVPGGTVRIEVPDIEELYRQGTDHPYWLIAMFGIQTHAGEVHLGGFTPDTLMHELDQVGFVVESWRCFPSEHPERPGYPCLEVWATRPEEDVPAGA